MKKTQDYQITITVQADVTEKSVREWLPQALEEGEWKYRTIKIYGTDITAINREEPTHKWIKDFK